MISKVPIQVEDTEWKVEKFEGKKPKDTKLGRWMKRWLPYRGKLPYEIVIGGEAKETTIEHPQEEKYADFLRRRYPRTVGRIKKRGTG